MSTRHLVRQDGTREPAFNAGLRGYKASSHEGCTHVPPFWYWPDRVAAGVDVDEELKAAYDAWWDSTEPFLVNEGLPETPPEEKAFRRYFEEQLRKTGEIPNWMPQGIQAPE